MARTAPNDSLTLPSLRERLLAIRERYHTKNHRFFDLWSAGRLDKRQMGYYLIQHSRMTRDGLRAYGLCWVKAPPDVQEHILTNLAEETGTKALTAESEAVDHRSLIETWTSACGYTAAEVAAIESVPAAEAVRHHWMHVAHQYPWPVFLATMTVLESQEVGIQSRVVPALLSHYGYAKGDPAIHFFEEHYEADQVHAERNLQFFDRHVHDRELWESCTEHAEGICKLRWHYMNEIYRHAVLGEGDELPA
jgi:pyrroloquinoline quinone (PQQ) biosynthesis protein C